MNPQRLNEESAGKTHWKWRQVFHPGNKLLAELLSYLLIYPRIQSEKEKCCEEAVYTHESMNWRWRPTFRIETKSDSAEWFDNEVCLYQLGDMAHGLLNELYLQLQGVEKIIEICNTFLPNTAVFYLHRCNEVNNISIFPSLWGYQVKQKQVRVLFSRIILGGMSREVGGGIF